MQFEDAKKYKKEIKELYTSAFPKEERAPLFTLYRKTKTGKNKFYAVTEEKSFVGLVYVVCGEGLVYVFYLAVAEKYRGCGYGSQILQMIKEMYSDCVVMLEIEDTEDTAAANYEERIKRLGFYERNGFQRLHAKTREAGVVYELLGTETSVGLAEFLPLMRKYLGGFLFRLIFRGTQFPENEVKI
ncbi:MAG: GNAT family N-acetyltransferase [Acetatifactor sp.]|nr:GNAT family N-acetyltransferase [Acetatifactor sp.]